MGAKFIEMPPEVPRFVAASSWIENDARAHITISAQTI